jgi:hypothetical protein
MRKGSPGPVADSAFNTGMIGAAIVGLLAIAAMYYWSGVPLPIAATMLVLIFPVYLVIAAALLNSWMGYGGDAIPLKRVTEEKTGSTGAFPTGETPTGDRSRSGLGWVLQRVAENPRTHLVLIAAAVVSGLLASHLGRDGIAIFAFGFGFLATIAALQILVWHRLKRAFERRAAQRTTDRWQPIGERSPEIKAGLTVALLVLGLLVLAVTVLRHLVV